ncbi:MAG TPA: MBL fold metallo-hydrolase [Bacteroidia bacterium]|nr:MBL fold metallo-hydrolase [Bacteroidia bacterium]
MNISFHGAARTVTGSKHLITLDRGLKILLDCGFFQGHGKDTDPMNRHFGFDPASVDYLILTHAHIDHSGNIPNLIKQGFTGKIICTAATRDLAAIMLADTAHIQENDIKYLNKRRAKKDLPPITPIYTINDVENAMENFFTIPYRKKFKLEEGVEMMFTDSGHILGAAAVHLTISENGKTKTICFTGDIGRPTDKILKSPEAFPQCDTLICESTYGNRLHEDAERTESRLLEIVHETCVVKKAKLIIPAFSLGRTQEVVYALNNLRNAKKLPPLPVYVDSPLSVNATSIMRAHSECFNTDMLQAMENDPDPFGFDNLFYIRRPEDSIKLNDDHRPMIIISASGMAEAGRVKHHIKNNIENPDTTILLVGYCTPESLGGRLGDGRKEVFIFGKKYEVKARVEIMNSYSAHADYNEMLEYLACISPKSVQQVFLVHGDYEAQVEWREKLKAVGYKNIEIPEKDSTWELT